MDSLDYEDVSGAGATECGLSTYDLQRTHCVDPALGSLGSPAGAPGHEKEPASQHPALSVTLCHCGEGK